MYDIVCFKFIFIMFAVEGGLGQGALFFRLHGWEKDLFW